MLLIGSLPITVLVLSFISQIAERMVNGTSDRHISYFEQFGRSANYIFQVLLAQGMWKLIRHWLPATLKIPLTRRILSDTKTFRSPLSCGVVSGSIGSRQLLQQYSHFICFGGEPRTDDQEPGRNAQQTTSHRQHQLRMGCWHYFVGIRTVHFL